MTHEIAAAWVVGGFIIANRPQAGESKFMEGAVHVVGIIIILIASSAGMAP